MPAPAITAYSSTPWANGVTVPSKRASMTEPSSEPPAVDTVPSSAAAVPATCGSGSIAAVLLFGISTATTGSSRAIDSPKSHSGGSPANTRAMIASSGGCADQSDGGGPDHREHARPASTIRALPNEPAARNRASTPKMIGN